MEAVVSRENMLRALRAVERNQGAAGVDGWLRRKLRCLIWRRWKRVHPRARRLIALGFTEAKAWRCASNGRGPWWNAGSSHMNAAYPAATFQRLGLVSLLATVKAYA